MSKFYQVFSLVCFAIGGMFLVGSVAVFFHLRIIEVIGELTGRTARKHIEAYRKGIEEQRPAMKYKEEETDHITHMFDQAEGKKRGSGSGETVLLIDLACAVAAEDETAALKQDEEEDEKTAVMEKQF